MKKLVIIQLMLCLAFVFIKSEVAEASTVSENEVWVEEGETIFTELPEGVFEGREVEARNSDYSAYSFQKRFTIVCHGANGGLISLCTVKTTGIVYFYTNGLVHLYTFNSSVEDSIDGYIVSVERLNLVNTDGSYSIGETYIMSSSLIYPYGVYRYSVYFLQDSTQTYTLFETLAEVVPQ